MSNKQANKQQRLEFWNKFISQHRGITDSIIFQSNSRDTYFLRAALRKQEKEGLWIENPNIESKTYTVKWDYGDSNIDFIGMEPYQFCNHFPDSRELTTKQGLIQNLNQITMPGVDVSSFFPRSYDMSDPKQFDLFIKDFNQTSIINVVEQHHQIFKSILKSQPQALQQRIANYIKEFSSLNHQQRTELKQNLEKQFFIQNQQDQGFINIIFLKQALFYCQSLLNDTNLDETLPLQKFEQQNDKQTCNQFFQKNCFLPYYKISQYNLELIQNYGTLNLPLKKIDEIEKKHTNQSEEDSQYTQKQGQIEGINDKEQNDISQSKLMKQKGWVKIYRNDQQSHNQFKHQVQSLDLFTVFQTLRIASLLSKYNPQYDIDGSKNIWICKPSYNARGQGIFCFNKKSDIYPIFCKKASCPKIIQKYIERPFLLRNLNPEDKNDIRKFDVRQWVLLVSMEKETDENENETIITPNPQVYLFEDAYIRICGKSYDENKLDERE